jgi:hypothetical protein
VPMVFETVPPFQDHEPPTAGIPNYDRKWDIADALRSYKTLLSFQLRPAILKDELPLDTLFFCLQTLSQR